MGRAGTGLAWPGPPSARPCPPALYLTPYPIAAAWGWRCAGGCWRRMAVSISVSPAETPRRAKPRETSSWKPTLPHRFPLWKWTWVAWLPCCMLPVSSAAGIGSPSSASPDPPVHPLPLTPLFFPAQVSAAGLCLPQCWDNAQSTRELQGTLAWSPYRVGGVGGSSPGLWVVCGAGSIIAKACLWVQG